jgi:hypothetical protein
MVLLYVKGVIVLNIEIIARINKMNEAQEIANVLFSETKDLDDARDILSVAHNRTKKPERWGETVLDVFYQPYQFSGVGSPEYNKAVNRKFDEKEEKIYKEFLQLGYQYAMGNFTTTNEADHYFNPKRVKPKWAEKMKKLKENKFHSYYKE